VCRRRMLRAKRCKQTIVGPKASEEYAEEEMMARRWASSRQHPGEMVGFFCPEAQQG
jgi:hypothetical protein